MGWFKKVWAFLSGKKLVIGAIADQAAIWAFAKGWIDQNDAIFVAGALSAWTGLALGHKGVKNVTGAIAMIVMLAALSGCSKKVQKIEIIPDAPNQESPAVEQQVWPLELEQEPVKTPVRALLKTVIYFDFDSDRIRANTVPALDRFLLNAQEHGLTVAKLRGHTCPIGEAIYNDNLGLRRANAVSAYLSQHGIKCDAGSGGEGNPVSTEPKNFHLNRRVEITGEYRL